MNLIINPSQPPGYTRPINNGSTRFALPIPGRSRLKPELEKTPDAGMFKKLSRAHMDIPNRSL
jgi:hypothetical protein